MNSVLLEITLCLAEIDNCPLIRVSIHLISSGLIPLERATDTRSSSLPDVGMMSGWCRFYIAKPLSCDTCATHASQTIRLSFLRYPGIFILEHLYKVHGVVHRTIISQSTNGHHRRNFF